MAADSNDELPDMDVVNEEDDDNDSKYLNGFGGWLCSPICCTDFACHHHRIIWFHFIRIGFLEQHLDLTRSSDDQPAPPIVSTDDNYDYKINEKKKPFTSDWKMLPNRIDSIQIYHLNIR